jgi:hypothetical protein
MTESQHKGDLLRELTRRKVFRSAVAYLVAAWLIVQVGSIVLPEFGAPSWAMRALIIVMVAGFPPAMILAWSIDFSVTGFTRTAESGYSRSRGIWPRLAVLFGATLVSVGILWLAWPNYVVKVEKSMAKPELKELAVIAVSPPVKISGSALSSLNSSFIFFKLTRLNPTQPNPRMSPKNWTQPNPTHGST